ncbi:MAG: Uma2 family endonuclease, partial [Pseudomonadota bacterium]
MSEAVRLPNPVSTKQYLSHESATGERHELIDGIMYAMVGGSDWHNLISLNLAGVLSQQLPDSCQVFEQSMKL